MCDVVDGRVRVGQIASGGAKSSQGFAQRIVRGERDDATSNASGERREFWTDGDARGEVRWRGVGVG